MRIQQSGSYLKVWISADETYNWAHEPGAAWPCSTLSGKRVFAEFGRNGLVDIAIDGRNDTDCDARELDAMIDDLLNKRDKRNEVKGYRQ